MYKDVSFNYLTLAVSLYLSVHQISSVRQMIWSCIRSRRVSLCPWCTESVSKSLPGHQQHQPLNTQLQLSPAESFEPPTSPQAASLNNFYSNLHPSESSALQPTCSQNQPCKRFTWRHLLAIQNSDNWWNLLLLIKSRPGFCTPNSL